MSEFPFSAVVGQDDAKWALLLAASEPRLGGVLLRGQKGSAKTTLARGLAALLRDDAPFVELPLGASEDRVVGSVDTAHLLREGESRLRPGLLAAAHGGVLYVDEINLLADHLVDTLLDVAVSGVGRVERDGVSHRYPSRFVLIATMNPEEGELRPQLLDRFGLSVDVVASVDPLERADAVRRQLEVERGDGLERFTDEDRNLRERLASLAPARAGDELIELASRVALGVGAEGLRADLMLVRAACAYAAWHARTGATEEDLRFVAPFVLSHRRRRGPFDDPGISDEEIDDAFNNATAASDDHPTTADDDAAPSDATDDGGGGDRPSPGSPREERHDAEGRARGVNFESRPANRATTSGRHAPAAGPRGRFVRALDDPATLNDVAVIPSALARAERGAGLDTAPDVGDLRGALHQTTAAHLIVIAVDTSGSMGAARRTSLAKALVLGLLSDAYQRRDRVALIAFGGERAELVLKPTGSTEVARARLQNLTTGGATPLAHALELVDEVSQRGGADGPDALCVIVTDGRATVGGENPLREAELAAQRLAQRRLPTLVVDAEDGVTRLGLARELARHLGARCLSLDELVDSGDLTRTVRVELAPGR